MTRESETCACAGQPTLHLPAVVVEISSNEEFEIILVFDHILDGGHAVKHVLVFVALELVRNGAEQAVAIALHVADLEPHFSQLVPKVLVLL